jgi:hypothetical protein
MMTGRLRVLSREMQEQYGAVIIFGE